MPTFNQLLKKKSTRSKKFYKTKTPALAGSPQRKAVCLKVYTTSPKKPNSAVRKVAKVRLTATKKKILAYVPGFSHNLAQYSTVLVRGGRVRDVPGMHYKIIRGKFDFIAKERIERSCRRSKFGISKKVAETKLSFLDKFLNPYFLFFMYAKPIAFNFVYHKPLLGLAVRHGLKTKGEKLLIEAYEIVRTTIPSEFSSSVPAYLNTAVGNLIPLVQVKNRVKSGVIQHVPAPIIKTQAQSKALNWLIKAVKSRSELSFSKRLAAELIDAYNSKGRAYGKKMELYRLVQTNRALLKSLNLLI